MPATGRAGGIVNRTLGRAAVVVAAPALLAACIAQTRGIGACGEYVDTPGTATIRAVDAAPAGEYNCTNDPVMIAFDFVPDDSALSARAATGWPMMIGSGANPPSSAVAACGLAVGSSHPAVRQDALSGSCTPVLIKLSDLGGAECQAALDSCLR